MAGKGQEVLLASTGGEKMLRIVGQRVQNSRAKLRDKIN